MIEDLKSDTAVLTNSIASLRSQIFGKDSMILLLNKGAWTKEEEHQLYDYHLKYLGYNFPALFSKRTRAQLYNAGGLRLIESQAASDSITTYTTNCELIEDIIQSGSFSYTVKTLDASSVLFDNIFIRFSPYDEGRLAAVPDPILLQATKKEIKRFTFFLEQDKDATMILAGRLIEQKKFAEALIHRLKSEYHLK